MTIEVTTSQQLSSDGNPTKMSLDSNCRALCSNDSQTQTGSATETGLRNFLEPQKLWVRSEQAKLVAWAFRTTRRKQPICQPNDTLKKFDNSTRFEGFTRHGKKEVFESSDEPALPENTDRIKPKLHSGQIQEIAYDNTEIFGIQHNSGNTFTENAGSNETLSQHTKDFRKSWRDLR